MHSIELACASRSGIRRTDLRYRRSYGKIRRMNLEPEKFHASIVENLKNDVHLFL